MSIFSFLFGKKKKKRVRKRSVEKAFLDYVKKNPQASKDLKKYSYTKDGLTRYLAYLQSPWKIIFNNFIAGVFYGFGFLIGAALVLGALGYIVKNIIAGIPIVGDSAEVFYNWITKQVDIYKTSQ